MIRPTVYQVVLRCSIVAMLSLLWDRFIDQGVRGIGFALEVFGLLLWIFVWFGYLKMDGVEFLNLKKRDENSQKHKFHIKDIIDFTNEHISPMEGLEGNEKSACRMVSNLLTGAICLLIGYLL